jgi:uncharacterized RDD family membrane protein YckC
MKSKFQPDIDSGVPAGPGARLIDPEAYDASEQQFADSIEGKVAPPRFVVDQEDGAAETPGVNVTGVNVIGDASPQECDPNTELLPAETMADQVEGSGLSVAGKQLQTELPGPLDSVSWRNEVAACVNHYRSLMSSRTPHYPSLQLKFDPPESPRITQSGPSQPAVSVRSSRLAVAMPLEAQSLLPETEAVSDRFDVTEAGGRILEFPRSAAAPPPLLDELAEPVVDRLRILEAPELLPPPPALGGILIEPVEVSPKERRPGFELPLQAAPMSRRLSAGAIDSLLVLSAFAIFAYIFFRVTSVVPPLQQALELSAALVGAFWIAYQYLLFVYTGTTPGLKLTKLRLSRFDGSAVPRKLRRWRVVASALSGMSLALGYAWCFIDEDRLCWHDRITRTYMAPQTAGENSKSPS